MAGTRLTLRPEVVELGGQELPGNLIDAGRLAAAGLELSGLPAGTRVIDVRATPAGVRMRLDVPGRVLGPAPAASSGPAAAAGPDDAAASEGSRRPARRPRHGPGRLADTEQSATEQSATEQSATEQSATEQSA
jgi:hypothetical protein